MPAFDVIGSRKKAVAIVEVPEEADEKAVAEEIMKLNKNVKSVLKKVSKRKGSYRLEDLELIAGDANTEVIHKEFGYILKLDPRKVYFSPREAVERQRISSQVKPKETVMVMFSGSMPYGIAIAKKQPKVKRIYGVEINEDAHHFAEENIRINKVSHLVTSILGDVKETCPKYYGICDRIVMPLPLGAENFLDIAINCLKKKGGVIYFYSWGKEEDLYSVALKQIEGQIKKLKKKFKVLDKRKVLPYSPRTFKICIDFKVAGVA
jgi:tRNA (guanine37-N1)-methyltransferase